MNKLKVMTVVGTRPEIIRLSCVIKKLDKLADHTLVHTGQNYDYELNEIFFKDLGLRKPDYFLNSAGSSGVETIGKVIINVDKVLAQVEPEAVLVLGDTNSCMVVISAKRRKIPTFHMEAGNRCFDQRVPEEINRRIVDHTADINLTYSTIARNYLLQEGLPPDCIVKTGSPMYEVLMESKANIDRSDILHRLHLKSGQYFVVSAHREENIEFDDNFNQLIETLNAVSEKYEYPVIVSTHPRTMKKIESLAVRFNPLIKLLKPLGFIDYIRLQRSSKAVLSDSGTISEESSILNFPALNLREAHERPEAMEEASVMMVGLHKERVLQGIDILEHQVKGDLRLFREVCDYTMPNVSDKVIRIIHSYVDYVNRVVWRK
ncbi:MAG: UDP-N-acetylglucosamine 2-epimerase (non-hydrolyzing) [Gammaproteobacteria bacterium]